MGHSIHTVSTVCMHFAKWSCEALNIAYFATTTRTMNKLEMYTERMRKGIYVRGHSKRQQKDSWCKLKNKYGHGYFSAFILLNDSPLMLTLWVLTAPIAPIKYAHYKHKHLHTFRLYNFIIVYSLSINTGNIVHA